jgi:hypothetical protein
LVEQHYGRGPSATPGGGQRQFNGFAGGDQQGKQGFVRVQNGGAADGDRGGRGRGGGGGGGGGRGEDAVGVGGVGQKGQHGVERGRGGYFFILPKAVKNVGLGAQVVCCRELWFVVVV